MSLVGRKFDVIGSDVFFEPMQLGRARDGHDPRFLPKQPGECDLSRRRFLLLRKCAKQIHQRLIRFPVLRRKARDDGASSEKAPCTNIEIRRTVHFQTCSVEALRLAKFAIGIGRMFV